MEEYQSPIKAKSLSFNKTFIVQEEKPKEEVAKFEYWVNLTAKLIKRPYFRTFKLVEKWPLEKIIRRYEIATKHNGNLPQDVKWWHERKINN